MRLEAKFATLGVDNGSLEKIDKMNLSTSQTFLLTRLVGNLKGSQVDFITLVTKLIFGQRGMEGSDIICEIFHFTFSAFWVASLMLSQVSKLFDALDNEGQIQDHHNGEEGKALINHEENTEMTSIFVPKTA